MSKYYDDKDRFLVAMDCIIFGFSEGELSLLLIKRKIEPAKGQWSLMGGFLRENESIDEGAKRVLNELTGLDNVYMEQVRTFGEVERDPGERVLSVAYYSLVKIEESDQERLVDHNAYWIKINVLPELIFAHGQMVELAKGVMRQKASTEPIGFNLLPDLFTLTQLQSLYEAIYGTVLDKRNFRKRVAEMDYIVKTDKIDKTGSKRGASLYKFNDRIYQKHPIFKL